MPKNITGNPAIFPAQTGPAAGEPRTSGSVEAPLQNAADRSQYLYDRLMFVDPTREGARRLRRFASLTDLKAATDIPTGTVAVVDGVGLYEYDSASTAAELSPIVVKPTVVGGGAGAWLVAGVGRGMLDVPNGVPQLDGAGKVPTVRLVAGDSGGRIVASAVRNGIVNLQAGAFIGPFETTSATYTEALSFTMNLLAGDRVVVLGQGHVWQYNYGANTYHYTRWAIGLDGGSLTPVASSEFWANPQSEQLPNALPICVNYTASADGLHKFSLEQKGNGLGGTMVVKNVSIAAIQVRP